LKLGGILPFVFHWGADLGVQTSYHLNMPVVHLAVVLPGY